MRPLPATGLTTTPTALPCPFAFRGHPASRSCAFTLPASRSDAALGRRRAGLPSPARQGCEVPSDLACREPFPPSGIVSAPRCGERLRVLRGDGLGAVEIGAGIGHLHLMLDRPSWRLMERRDQRFAELGQLVLDARRHCRIHGARREAVALGRAASGQHALRNVADGTVISVKRIGPSDSVTTMSTVHLSPMVERIC